MEAIVKMEATIDDEVILVSLAHPYNEVILVSLTHQYNEMEVIVEEENVSWNFHVVTKFLLPNMENNMLLLGAILKSPSAHVAPATRRK